MWCKDTDQYQTFDVKLYMLETFDVELYMLDFCGSVWNLSQTFLVACCSRMDAHIKDLKAKRIPEWKRQLVLSFETTLSDPKVSSNVQRYTVPDTDPVESLRGQLGLKTAMASDIFVIGVYRSRMMLELPTYVEQER